MEITENTEFALIGLLIKKPEMLDHCELISNFEAPFSDHRLNIIFRDIKKLYTMSGKCDKRQLMKMGIDNQIAQEFYFIVIQQSGFDVNIQEYISSVYNYHVKQKLEFLAQRLINCSKDDLNDAYEFLKITRNLVDEVEKNSVTTTGVTLPQACDKVLDKAIRMADGDNNEYMATGILAIDRIIKGLITKTMSVIGARPSVGKSALGLTMMSNMASMGTSCGFISVEMSEVECVERLTQVRSGVSIYEFGDERQARRIMPRFTTALDGIKHSTNMQIVRTTNRRIGNIRSIARKMKNQDPNLKIIFVDYLQKIKGDDSSAGIREQIIEVSATLTDMASDMDLHICCMAQLNRSGDDLPKMIHLKESGSLEQDAHYVFLLHRELGSDEPEGDATVFIAKNRGGMTGTAQIKFQKKTTRFYDDAHDYSEER